MDKDLVSEGYRQIAEKYSSTRDQFKSLKYLKKINSLLQPNSTVLDLGCGSGKPIDEFFAKHGHKIIGIDICPEQIEAAKKNIPTGSFIVKDIANLKKGEFRVEAVVSFYTIFHLPRKKHQQIFNKISSFLGKGGLLLVTMGAKKWEGVENFHGVPMYWSHYGPQKNKKIIEKAGFEILLDEIDAAGEEKHQIILAKKL